MTKRLIRDIQPSQRIRAKIDARTTPEKKVITKRTSPTQKKSPSGGVVSPTYPFKKNLAIFTGLLFVGVFIWSLFSTAVVAITPRSQDLEIRNLELLLQKKEGGLSYHEIVIEESESISIPATETQYQEEKASGVITVFNAHGTASQRLLEETRFESPDGKIYKTAKGAGVTIPGGKMQGGKLIPGSLDITVYADQPGQEYNLGFSDFSIPGFKGSSKEKTFYARSKTEITGGFKGERVVISEETILLSEKKLEGVLREKLNLQLDAQVSRDFFVPSKDGSHIELLSVERVDIPGSELQLKQKGILRAPVIDRKEFSLAIADASLSDKQKGVGRIVNLDDLSYVFHSTEESSSNTNTISVSISGLGNLVWDIQEKEVVELIEKTKKKDISNVLQNMESIVTVEVSIRPFWKSRLPKKEKIHVIINNPHN